MRAPAQVEVIGGGPAGSAAALAALAEGSAVTIYEKARFPRHKVCGEFLSPEAGPILESLGLWPAFLDARPAGIARAVLYLRGRAKRIPLPEPAHGLSRAALDQLLLEGALRRGAECRTERRRPEASCEGALVLAHGRRTRARAGSRLFGFQAHFRGAGSQPLDDAVELHFLDGGYVGLSPVEDGALNVCGLAREELLREHEFRPEALLPADLALRLGRLARSSDWLRTGPLVFRDQFADRSGAYLAGDALGFVDPFTGSGILAALATGALAGRAASRGLELESYRAECRRALAGQHRVASALRGLIGSRLTEGLARWIPGGLLYRLTRPREGKSGRGERI